MSYVEGSEGPLGESANAGGSDRLSGSSPSIDKDFTLPTATQFERELDQVRAAEALMALEGHQPETMTIPDTQEPSTDPEVIFSMKSGLVGHRPYYPVDSSEATLLMQSTPVTVDVGTVGDNQSQVFPAGIRCDTVDPTLRADVSNLASFHRTPQPGTFHWFPHREPPPASGTYGHGTFHWYPQTREFPSASLGQGSEGPSVRPTLTRQVVAAEVHTPPPSVPPVVPTEVLPTALLDNSVAYQQMLYARAHTQLAPPPTPRGTSPVGSTSIANSDVETDYPNAGQRTPAAPRLSSRASQLSCHASCRVTSAVDQVMQLATQLAAGLQDQLKQACHRDKRADERDRALRAEALDRDRRAMELADRLCAEARDRERSVRSEAARWDELLARQVEQQRLDAERRDEQLRAEAARRESQLRDDLFELAEQRARAAALEQELQDLRTLAPTGPALTATQAAAPPPLTAIIAAASTAHTVSMTAASPPLPATLAAASTSLPPFTCTTNVTELPVPASAATVPAHTLQACSGYVAPPLAFRTPEHELDRAARIYDSLPSPFVLPDLPVWIPRTSVVFNTHPTYTSASMYANWSTHGMPPSAPPPPRMVPQPQAASIPVGYTSMLPYPRVLPNTQPPVISSPLPYVSHVTADVHATSVAPPIAHTVASALPITKPLPSQTDSLQASVLTADTIVPPPTAQNEVWVPITPPQRTTALPTTLVVKQPQLPKPYNGQTSHKSFKDHFERVCKVNGWDSNPIKVQYLTLALEGPAAEILKDIDESSATAYDDIWRLLARRFGQTDAPRDAMRRFDTRRQQDGESISEFDSALRFLHREAWPTATVTQRDSDLKRRFEDGVSNPELTQFLRLHARDDDFSATVLKARQYLDASEVTRPKKSVRMVSPPPPPDHTAPTSTASMDPAAPTQQLLKGMEDMLDRHLSSLVQCVTVDTNARNMTTIASRNGNSNSNKRPLRPNNGDNPNSGNGGNNSSRDNRPRDTSQSPVSGVHLPSPERRFDRQPPRSPSSGRNTQTFYNRQSCDYRPSYDRRPPFRSPTPGRPDFRYQQRSQAPAYRLPSAQRQPRDYNSNHPPLPSRTPTRSLTPTRCPNPGCFVCGHPGCHSRYHRDDDGRMTLHRPPPSRNTFVDQQDTPPVPPLLDQPSGNNSWVRRTGDPGPQQYGPPSQ